ncbi:MAG: hypothetical protein [Bacteriophage sp.]|nr:MAG: hypothetical protein [Bacteriophage sp.]UWI35990.1 MAG: hypothetical protein [Bacteriophage sp.]
MLLGGWRRGGRRAAGLVPLA